jgi:hypothetical protein
MDSRWRVGGHTGKRRRHFLGGGTAGSGRRHRSPSTDVPGRGRVGTDLRTEAGDFNPIAAESSPRQRMIRFLYALRGGAPGFSVLTLLVALASVAMYPLTVFLVYLYEGRRKFVNHPLLAFVLPSATGKSLLARVMEGAFY